VQNQPFRSTQPGHPSVGRHSEYQQKLGSKQAHHKMHDLAMLAGVWLRTSEMEITAYVQEAVAHQRHVCNVLYKFTGLLTLCCVCLCLNFTWSRCMHSVMCFSVRIQ